MSDREKDLKIAGLEKVLQDTRMELIAILFKRIEGDKLKIQKFESELASWKARWGKFLFKIESEFEDGEWLREKLEEIMRNIESGGEVPAKDTEQNGFSDGSASSLPVSGLGTPKPEEGKVKR